MPITSYTQQLLGKIIVFLFCGVSFTWIVDHFTDFSCIGDNFDQFYTCVIEKLSVYIHTLCKGMEIEVYLKRAKIEFDALPITKLWVLWLLSFIYRKCNWRELYLE